MSKVIGAIVGDIVGSIYEFDNIKTKDFPLFTDINVFTDDSILTVATMEALLKGGTSENFISSYQRLGNKYPSSYGVRFGQWLKSKTVQPYDSWGNGSAMRVSPVAWFYDNLVAVENVAKTSASITHNHPEGVKGAQAVSSAIFLARNGKTKNEIKRYVENKYDYMLDFALDDIRPWYDFDESCAGTVPPAIVAFLESLDFEDAVRNAVSLGGDSDTLVAITGSIAEAFYGVPAEICNEAVSYLPDELRKIVKEFSTKIAVPSSSR